MDVSSLLQGANLTTPAIFIFFALGGASVLAFAVTVMKLIQFGAAGINQRKSADERTELWLSGDADQAISQARSARSVLAKVQLATMSAVTSRPNDATYAEEIGRQSALKELTRLSRHLRVLEAVVQAAPMLGLLGTVIGMIEAFGQISQSTGAVDPAVLAGGIWTALSTTAVGLTIAVVFYFVSVFLESRVETARDTMNLIISSCIYGRVDI